MTREDQVEKILDELEEEFAKVNMLVNDKLTLFAKVSNAIYKCAEQEPCTDIISRESVKNIIRGGVSTDTEADIEYVCGLIDDLPSVPTSERVGWWIPTGYDGYADGNPVYDWWECSECEWEHTGDENTLTPYCPNCGAKMEVEK